MATTLTTPQIRRGSPLVVGGIGLLAWLSDDGNRATGSNVAWLERALPEFPRAPAEDLYALSIQRPKSLSTKAPEARIAPTDRDSLLEVKHVLSLTAGQLAQAMGVSRSALYHWLDERKTMRAGARTQLGKLAGLAGAWLAAAGTPLARCRWVHAANRARVAALLGERHATWCEDARAFLEILAAGKPGIKPLHRSILEIIRDENWGDLPEHVREAEKNSRLPSARTNIEET
ncbi:MAG: hypothetical protein NTW21_16690 [Verrucomicrobia bacterium]|nr:hypothetical protein [Verrucomicrobiota bacterium]